MSSETIVDSAWCEALFESLADKLILYGRALGLDHGEAEDVVQDLFIRLFRLTKAPENPTHYCLRAYRNRALNYKKRLWRRIRKELESTHWFEPDLTEADPREAEAMRCLRQLPLEQREVVVLKIWHGLTFAAIGEMLDVSPNTIAGRYRYGLQKLRRALGETDHGRNRKADPVLGAAARLKRA